MREQSESSCHEDILKVKNIWNYIKEIEKFGYKNWTLVWVKLWKKVRKSREQN